MRLHTGEKSFECKICFKKFSDDSHRKIHVDKVHTAKKTLNPPEKDIDREKHFGSLIPLDNSNTATGTLVSEADVIESSNSFIPPHLQFDFNKEMINYPMDFQSNDSSVNFLIDDYLNNANAR